MNQALPSRGMLTTGNPLSSSAPPGGGGGLGGGGGEGGRHSQDEEEKAKQSKEERKKERNRPLSEEHKNKRWKLKQLELGQLMWGAPDKDG